MAGLSNTLSLLLVFFRYAEIVNVKLGNGQNRKGQVLEIAGRKAVVQVRKIQYSVQLRERLLIDSVDCSSGTNYYIKRALVLKCARRYYLLSH